MRTVSKLTLATAVLVAFTGLALAAEPDLKRGKKVFKKCKICHKIGPRAKNRVGPILTGVIDRKAATVKGFKYSPAMKKKAEEGLVWTEEMLHKYLEKPKDVVPGGRMAFPGLSDENDRNNVIAYIKEKSKKKKKE